MKKRVLLGTTNPAKVEHLRELLAPLPIEVLSARDLGIDGAVREDGCTLEENAVIKARAYFARSHIPTLSTDAGLTIERLPAEKQPGMFVRRIHGGDHRPSDEELLAHYARELAQVGGESAGVWQVAVALALSPDRIVSHSTSRRMVFTSRPSAVRLPGAPLGALALDPATGRYYSEMPYREWAGFQTTLEFVRQHLDEL